MSFASELSAEITAIRKANEEVIKVTAINLFSSIILSSPVGNPDLWVWKHPTKGYVDYVSYKGYPEGYVGGAFRSNWYLTFDSPSNQWNENNIISQQQKINEIGGIATGGVRDKYILANNAPYAQRLENGWSTQAPAGSIVQANVSKANANFTRYRNAAYKKYGVKQ